MENLSTKQSKLLPNQFDWRWVERYRELASFDSYWWLAPAGPFSQEEQQQWNELFSQALDAPIKAALGKLIATSCRREFQAAIVEQRQPQLHYPALAIEEVRSRIEGLLHLDTEVCQQEPNAIVRRLYHETIDEELWFLRLIEATYEGNSECFWHYNLQLNPLPTLEEMNYALSRLTQVLRAGFLQEGTSEISKQLLSIIQKQLHLSPDFSAGNQATPESPRSVQTPLSQSDTKISLQAARQFFEAVLRQCGYDGWQVVVDPNASSPRVEQGLRCMYIPERKLTVGRIKHYLSHELAGHAARCLAGERSKLGLLGIHSRNSLETEEGLSVYYDRLVEIQQGKIYDDVAIWASTLAVGMASGVVVPPQRFLSLYIFFERFYLLYELLRNPKANVQKLQEWAKKAALDKCLRTYRGVPDLQQAGICYTKDALYLRGLWKIERSVAEDSTVLDRLAIGVVALDRLPDMQELGMVAAPRPLQELLNDPNLDAFILSFESIGETPA